MFALLQLDPRRACRSNEEAIDGKGNMRDDIGAEKEEMGPWSAIIEDT